MRALIQRVKEASVTVDEKTVARIGNGLLVLLGIEGEDASEDIQWLCNKIANLRIFNDEAGVMNNSLIDTKGEVIVVSQFTLHASTKKGNRPSYIKAARPEIAEPLYEEFIASMNELVSGKVQKGVFGAMMDVGLINDGPVTIMIDTKNKQ